MNEKQIIMNRLMSDFVNKIYGKVSEIILDKHKRLAVEEHNGEMKDLFDTVYKSVGKTCEDETKTLYKMYVAIASSLNHFDEQDLPVIKKILKRIWMHSVKKNMPGLVNEQEYLSKKALESIQNWNGGRMRKVAKGENGRYTVKMLSDYVGMYLEERDYIVDMIVDLRRIIQSIIYGPNKEMMSEKHPLMVLYSKIQYHP